MVSSHLLLLFMASSLFGTKPQKYMPTPKSVGFFLAYHFSQYFFARIMPGVYVPGQTGLGYWCNAYTTFYATLASAGALHYYNIFNLTTLVKEYPSYLMTAVIIADIYAILIHLVYARGWKLFSPYEFFMGVGLHPR